MSARPYLRSLLPAIVAALCGAGTLLVWQNAPVAVAAAALGAAVGGLLSMRDEVASPRIPIGDGPRLPERPLAPIEDVTAVLPLAALVIGADRVVAAVNGAAREIFGTETEVGRPISMLRSPRLLDQVDATLGDGQPRTLELTLARQSETHLRAHVRPLPQGGVLVIVEDLTEMTRAQELHRDFVANASHELKTPLAAVSGIIETLLGHARQDRAASERFLGLLATQVNRMTRLVEDLMSLNRIELNARVAPVESQRLSQILQETADAFQPIAEAAGIDLVCTADAADIVVHGDRDEMAQLFGNLVDNAIRYSGKGTTIRICRSKATPDTAGMVGIAIADQGIGIAREHLPRLTERFYRVNVRQSRERGGTGLGLAIVKHILNRHRGRLEIDSTPGAGTTATVWLPVVRAADGASRLEAAAS